MKWSEINESIHRIEFDFDDGSVQGYSVESSAEQLPNWLSRHGFDDPMLVDKIRNNYQEIAFLDNINVEEDSRGNGIGNDLLDSFESEAQSQGAQVIFLIADLGESQADGFDLVAWYESHGFRLIKSSNSGPLLAKVL